MSTHVISGASRLIVLATGGTGGHVFPAQALATEMAGRGYRLVLVTDRRGDEFGGQLGNLPTFRIQAAGVTGKNVVNRVISAGELAIGTIQAWRILRKLLPAAVVGFGGYASMPTMVAANFLGLHTVIHEQNAILGRANRLLGARVQGIATCYDAVKGIPAEVRIGLTGMPVRSDVVDMRSHAYPALNEKSPIRLLVMGGSQGASIFSRVIPFAIERLKPALRNRISIVQQCRSDELDGVQAVYTRIGVPMELDSFFDDLPRRLTDAHLVVTRAGASSIAEVTTIGRPAILVPYPHSTDDHQTFNGHAFDAAGGGWVMPDKAFTKSALSARLDALFSYPATLQQAAAASRAAGQPDATARLADFVEAQIGSNGGFAAHREAA